MDAFGAKHQKCQGFRSIPVGNPQPGHTVLLKHSWIRVEEVQPPGNRGEKMVCGDGTERWAYLSVRHHVDSSQMSPVIPATIP